MDRIVDPYLFTLEAAHIDWLVAIRRRGELAGPVLEQFKRSERSRYTCALRWHVAANHGNFDGDEERGIGLPTGPFTVYRRPSVDIGPQPIGFDLHHMSFPFDLRVMRFEEPMGMVRITVNTTNPGVVYGLLEPSDIWSIVTHSAVPAGGATIELHGGGMCGLMFQDSMTVVDVEGVPQTAWDGLPDWDAVEIVGMPVDQGSWSGIGDHATDQGLVGALTDPRSAALDRLRRGEPAFGWRDQMAPGVTVPPWKAPDANLLLKELDDTLMPGLHDALAVQQVLQMLEQLHVPVPPPENFNGQQMSGNPNDGKVSPIAVLQMGVSSDVFLSLALGYGTNVDEQPNQADVKPYHDGSRFDYMVTAPYAKGLDGESDPVELVAYAFRPTQAVPPPVPTQLSAEHRAHEAPSSVDEPWVASTLVRWQRLPKNTVVRTASYAAARANAGASAATLMMEQRPSGGHRPIAPAQAASDPEKKTYAYLTDPYFQIPNNPGTRSFLYGVATQDLFGLWSDWRTVPHTAVQPGPVPPRIVSAALDLPAPAVGPPGNKVCTGTLTVDFVWDWTDRGPHVVRLAGRLYAAGSLGDPPPSAAEPNAFQRTIGGAQPKVVVDFQDGATFRDVAFVDGVITNRLVYLDPAGANVVAAGPGQSDRVRRYRLTVPNITVDFSTTTHVGMALWVSGQERLAPGHQTAHTGPFLTFASDPVAPASNDVLPIVPLGSMPDAEGCSHGHLSWPAVPGTDGYYVYEADEFTLLAAWGLPEPSPDASLSERYDVVLDHFRAQPVRRPFTRLSSRPVTTNELDITMPKGSRSIHLYLVVTAGPGGTEGPWPVPVGPADPVQMMAYAAPRIAVPPPPELLVTADASTGTASVELTTRAGFGVAHLDLHRVRVDEAARAFDTMGPPVAVIPGSGGGGYTRTAAGTGRFRFDGVDNPGPSWKRVWYRAVAWSEADGQRGLVSGRSAPSNPFSVVVPPATPPDLSALVAVWPGGDPNAVEVRFTSTAPRWKTPLGWHRLEVLVTDITDVTSPVRILPAPADPPGSFTAELGALPSAEPGTGSGVWAPSTGSPHPYRVTIARSPAAEPVRVEVRMVDPLGRVTTRSLDVAQGPMLPPPELHDITFVQVMGVWVLSFSTTAPLQVNPPYTLSVSAQQQRFGFPIPVPPIGPRPRPRRFTTSAALDAIPVVNAIPAGQDPLTLVRSHGNIDALTHQFGVVVRVPISHIGVTLTSPDGRTASFTREI